MSHSSQPLDPGHILQTAFAFWSSKVLLTAVEFGVFSQLAERRITGAELGRELGLHPRGISDFFDSLVAMKFLGRDGVIKLYVVELQASTDEVNVRIVEAWQEQFSFRINQPALKAAPGFDLRVRSNRHDAIP